MTQQRDVAYWNKDTGALWVEPADGGAVQWIADGIADLDAAYAALAGLGFARWTDWGIVPGIPRRRFAEVFRP